jgi:hypothetical protein
MFDQGLEGRVLYEFVVSPAGRIELGTLRPVEWTRPEFLAAALPTVEGTTFWPACVDRRPVRFRVLMPVAFRIMR